MKKLASLGLALGLAVGSLVAAPTASAQTARVSNGKCTITRTAAEDQQMKSLLDDYTNAAVKDVRAYLISEGISSSRADSILSSWTTANNKVIYAFGTVTDAESLNRFFGLTTWDEFTNSIRNYQAYAAEVSKLPSRIGINKDAMATTMRTNFHWKILTNSSTPVVRDPSEAKLTQYLDYSYFNSSYRYLYYGLATLKLDLLACQAAGASVNSSLLNKTNEVLGRFQSDASSLNSSLGLPSSVNDGVSSNSNASGSNNRTTPSVSGGGNSNSIFDTSSKNPTILIAIIALILAKLGVDQGMIQLPPEAQQLFALSSLPA
ncbi:MAG: hypothetical protein Q3962_09420 [Corynebacterium sp.]|nr:hypothetical protein [Corynebacterium sp.]